MIRSHKTPQRLGISRLPFREWDSFRNWDKTKLSKTSLFAAFVSSPFVSRRPLRSSPHPSAPFADLLLSPQSAYARAPSALCESVREVGGARP